MDSFIEALLSEKTDKIPDEYDWFAPLLGDWDCDYFDEPSEGHKRHVKGEWLFRRILEGAGIQDIFIFPSRATKEAEPQPDGEYGSSFRMFNKAEGHYDVVYTCDHSMKRLLHLSRYGLWQTHSFRTDWICSHSSKPMVCALAWKEDAIVLQLFSSIIRLKVRNF